jgi:DNA-damage-inducible protein J
MMKRRPLIMASTIQVRVDDELKKKSDSLFKDLGTDTTTAIRMFLTQAVAENGFPFEIKRRSALDPYTPMTEKEMLDKLKTSREQDKYRDADSVISDMRVKYGL